MLREKKFNNNNEKKNTVKRIFDGKKKICFNDFQNRVKLIPARIIEPISNTRNHMSMEKTEEKKGKDRNDLKFQFGKLLYLKMYYIILVSSQHGSVIQDNVNRISLVSNGAYFWLDCMDSNAE